MLALFLESDRAFVQARRAAIGGLAMSNMPLPLLTLKEAAAFLKRHPVTLRGHTIEGADIVLEGRPRLAVQRG